MGGFRVQRDSFAAHSDREEGAGWKVKTDSLFVLAWKTVPKLPPRLVDWVSGGVGRIVAAFNVGSVRQLRQNFTRLAGREPSRKEISDAVASYFRMFGQQLSLPGWSAEYLRNGCTYSGAEQTRTLMEDGPVVLALTHSGNWDLAGAWFCQNYGGIVTVAEKLEPPELFEGFVAFRESLGMEILGVGPGESVFGQLVEQVRGRSLLVPLLADRDISGSGVRVKLGGAEALVAAGPAALALKLGRPLIAGHIGYRKRNGRWVIRANFTDPIAVPEPGQGENLVEAYTRAWVQEIEPIMQAGVVDWHMMQKLYVDDLDPDRLARAEERHRQKEAQT